LSTLEITGTATATPPTVIDTVAPEKSAPGYDSDHRAGTSDTGTYPRLGHAENAATGAALKSPITHNALALL
jgi:hypothetical protein